MNDSTTTPTGTCGTIFFKVPNKIKKWIESPTVWAAAAAADATQGCENLPCTIPPKAEEEEKQPKTKKLLVDIKSMAKKTLNLLLARSVKREEEEEQKDETLFSIFHEENPSNDQKDLGNDLKDLNNDLKADIFRARIIMAQLVKQMRNEEDELH
jgi:hypothetical protein